mmetsp:Transcript_11244/g.34931  ORF Transcript_11244/g.34931 Transcript_11244/m.34931 type:complete len:227 (-) Transcript_11244:568-1248(-)
MTTLPVLQCRLCVGCTTVKPSATKSASAASTSINVSTMRTRPPGRSTRRISAAASCMWWRTVAGSVMKSPIGAILRMNGVTRTSSTDADITGSCSGAGALAPLSLKLRVAIACLESNWSSSPLSLWLVIIERSEGDTPPLATPIAGMTWIGPTSKTSTDPGGSSIASALTATNERVFATSASITRGGLHFDRRSGSASYWLSARFSTSRYTFPRDAEPYIRIVGAW